MTDSRSTPCVYCGDSPISHPFHYIESTVTCVLGSFSKPRLKKVPRVFQLERSELVQACTSFSVWLLHKLGGVKYNTDLEQSQTKRTRCIWREAEKRGIRVEELVAFGAKRESQRALLPRYPGDTKRAWHYFQSIPIPPWRNQYGLGWVDDKFVLKKVFTKQNLPIPRGRSVLTAHGARKVLNELGVPVITKPREGSRGRHTTIAISTPEEVTQAFGRAKQLCAFVLVEEYIPGKVYRATCVDGKVIGIMELVRPTVTADGVRTVAELREYHNAHNKDFPELTDVEDNALFRTAMMHQGYELTDVPDKGTEILLAEFSERTNGGYFTDLTDDVPLSTIDTINRAAKTCGVDVVGFDIISKDLTSADERFVFIEANSLPYIEIHDIPYAGTPRSVASAVFDLWT